MIRNFLASLRGRTDSAEASPKTAPGAARKTVLIVDGDESSLQALALALAAEGYLVDTAGNAVSADRKLSCSRPDLILVDLQVAAADGTPLARRLVADEDLVGVPVVALTDRDTARGSQCDGVIGKAAVASEVGAQIRAVIEAARKPGRVAGLPLPEDSGSGRRKHAAELLAVIEEHLPDSQFAHGAQTGLQRLAGALGSLHDYELTSYLEQAERLSDAATVRSRSRYRLLIRLCRELVEREPEVTPGFAGLRRGYIENRRAELSRLEPALRSGDFTALRKAGHNLKGTGAAYGFAELTEIGRAFEAAAKNEDASAIEVLLEQIDSYLDIVGPALENREEYVS